MFFRLIRASQLWFWLSMTGVAIGSLLVRCWGLSQLNSLVFDEVYYARFANNYLIGTPFFNTHPPLAQYLIAVGIWIGSLPASPDGVNALTGSSMLSYRWMNAATGSLVPLIVGAIAYWLSQNRAYTLMAALLTAADGLLLVESRYALSNIYLVFFGLLGISSFSLP